MRKETNNWWKQAEADLDKIQILIESKHFDGAVFFAQQAVEKALKALCLIQLKEIPREHSIIYLAQKIKVSSNLLSGIRDLNPEYLATRYPDVASGVPAELYDKEIAKRHYKTAKDVLTWVKKQMQK